jgi:hypothetical protein
MPHERLISGISGICLAQRLGRLPPVHSEQPTAIAADSLGIEGQSGPALRRQKMRGSDGKEHGHSWALTL